MALLDTASLPLRPLLDLTRDPGVRPSLLAEGAEHWAGQPDATGWSAARAPARGLRELLRRAGLVPPDDPLDLPAAVRARVDGGADPLWTARLMFQLGRYAEGLELADRVPTPWRDLLLAQHGAGEPPPPAKLTGHAAQLTAALLAPQHGNPAEIAIASRIAQEVSAEDARLGAVARARVLAAQAPDDGAVTEVRAELVAGRAGAPADVDFLLREAEECLLLAAAEAALSTMDLTRATAYAADAVALDPTGAEAQLLAARVAHARGDDLAARAHYRSAARLGLCERGPALVGLIDLGTGPSLVGATADLLTFDPATRSGRLRVLAGRRDELSGGIVADWARWAGEASARPLPLERYRPFLDLCEPSGLDTRDLPPVTIHTPLMSYAAVRERAEPWFREVHPQRATAAMFRSELEHTAAVFGYGSAAASATYETWLHAEDGCPPDLRERLAHPRDESPLDRALLARLVSALGFHASAKELVPGPDVSVRDPEEAYGLASWLFAEQMLTTGHAAELDPLFRKLYAQLGDDIRFARMKVVTSINATVNAARRREPETIAYWRAEGERTLAEYVALPDVDEFNASLMTSRWYRAMGFLPFLTGDREQLLSDMDQWLGIAQELTGYDEHTRVIAADNYFPAVETAVRTHTFLGQHDLALSLVEKLAADIDPIDPKTWLTAGELRYEAGDVTGALDAYERAANLQFPYGRLSWFNAGQCHEQLGHHDEAVECYRRSLQHWPTGVTPLRRLRDLHARGLLASDAGLLITWAGRQPAWSALPEFAG